MGSAVKEGHTVSEAVTHLVSTTTRPVSSVCQSSFIGSYELESCQPNPKCQDFTTDFRQDLSRILTNGTEYDGDAEPYDWISESRARLTSAVTDQSSQSRTSGSARRRFSASVD